MGFLQSPNQIYLVPWSDILSGVIRLSNIINMDEFALLILLPPIRQDFRFTDDISTETAFFKGSLGYRVQLQPWKELPKALYLSDLLDHHLSCAWLGTPITSPFHPVQTQPPCSFLLKPDSTSCTAQLHVSSETQEAQNPIFPHASLSCPSVGHCQCKSEGNSALYSYPT